MHLIPRTHHSLDPKMERISAVEPLRFRPRHEIEAISNACDELVVPPGRVLCQRGHFAREAFLVLRGSVAVVVDDELVRVAEAGEMIGELGCLGARFRSADLVTLTECDLLVTPASRLGPLMGESPGVVDAMQRGAGRDEVVAVA